MLDGKQVTVDGVRSIESRNGSVLLRGPDALRVEWIEPGGGAGIAKTPMYEVKLDQLDRIELADEAEKESEA